MPDMEKVINGVEHCFHGEECCGDIECPYYIEHLSDSCCLEDCQENLKEDVIAMLKEPEKKQITLHKRHVITWKHDDEFTTRKLYEAVCETLMDEGELVIVRTDDHEKVNFVFYVVKDW